MHSRSPGLHERFVVDDPGLGLRQFVYRCTGSNDLGDGSSARPTALVTSSRVRRLMASTPQAVVTRPPAVRRTGMQRLSGLWLTPAGTWRTPPHPRPHGLLTHAPS